MTRLKWSEDYSVGDAEIDAQHQQLFALIDRLEDHDLDASALSITFDKLKTYVQEHFRDEEALLEDCNYPDLEAHKRLHLEFEDWITTARESFRCNPDTAHVVGGNLQVFLRDWMLAHILKADQAYKNYIK